MKETDYNVDITFLIEGIPIEKILCYKESPERDIQASVNNKRLTKCLLDKC